MFIFLPLLAGLGGATALAGVGALGAGLAADGLNYLFGDDDKNADKLRATKGVTKGVAGAATINAGIATGAGLIEAAPIVAATAAPHVNKIAKVGKELAKKGTSAAGNMFKKGMINAADKTYKAERAAENALLSKPDYYTNLANDVLNPMPPATTVLGQAYNGLSTGFDQYERSKEKNNVKISPQTNRTASKSDPWWDR